ncbi:LacI family transcriptional regulator [Rhizobium ruizarguesonis]|uniref:LacI family transcriptional regulator n=1 Tax=Rhizobium ruizarguesonis TaxID=2081791 RepID=A0ABY1WZH5_9HYPH|nr:substrate-binding domain-containing protein [Rhizobium ruizarguesonis]MBY5830192.1 LacI family transcriptional regulator [Rhizobium leguminosarum]TCA69166.1 LacI family transcriptional regulator [Rhizobium leguminosarum bv. viciae]MBC2807573.1 substrate-binding domain-containing protein [Rhizobium ruizarguesonis]MBY5849245.1 LacI family transcriptional regulator [Rhizobium leguminosarum]MBY5858897.1 LacI family transcriptional regulator [Rhizobium leguminosarum]
MKGIRQLAEHLNISIGTVSRALNGKPDVNQETRRRVLAAAEELGYVANQSGRSLRQGETKVIGLMIESSKETVENADNFFLGVTSGLQSVFARHKLDLIMLPCPSDEDPHEYLKRMVARRIVDAMIISDTQRVDRRIDFLSRAKIPFVALGRSLSASNFPWIDLDFEGVADHAVERLIALGHRRIAITAPSSEANLGYLFIESYRRALERHDIPFDPSLVIRVRSSEQGGYQAAHELLLLEERPTAVILIYELMAIGLYRRLMESGVMPGRDLAVIGFRDAPRARFLQPSLSCFRISLYDLGVALGRMLLATMPAYRQFYPGGDRNIIWPLELMSGESDAFDVGAMV